jgi:fructose-specific component phosphotransferase system IIB-like protein
MESLQKIVADPVRIDIAGGREEIKPIKTRELPKLFKAIKPVLADLQELFKRIPNGADDAAQKFIMAYLMNGSDQLVESLIQATAIASRKEREWVDNLDLDELVLLIGKLVEVNGDFLAQRVLPQFADAMDAVTNVFLGPEQSTSLSEQDTD